MIKLNKSIFIIILVFICFFSIQTIYASENTYIIKLKDDINLFGFENKSPIDRIKVVNKQELDIYLKSGQVEKYESNEEVELFNNGWNADIVNADFSWNLGCFGNDIKVGVIDSGIKITGDINSNVIEGYNFLNSNKDLTDNIGHGTFVSSIIASDTYGFATKCKIVPLKCFEKNTSTYTDTIVKAVYGAVDDYNCKVINLSLGVRTNSSILEDSINYAVSKGVIVVAAVGNYSSSTYYYPAAYNNAIGVGSVGVKLNHSTFSQTNDSVYVVAPGENINGIRVSGFYNTRGTSFSTPHISALAAIAKSIDNNITSDKFKKILSETSVDLGDVGYDILYGYGLVDFEAFINNMISDSDIFISPINFDGKNNYVNIYNNTLDKLSFKCIYGCYDNNKLIDYKTEDIVLNPLDIKKITSETVGNKIKYMLWKDLITQIPLTDSKEYILNNN